MRVAVIDLGSNSVILCIVEKSDNCIKPLYEESIITRIGKNIELTRRLDPQSVRSTLEVLRKYKNICDNYKVSRIECFATDAIRDAEESKAFIANVESLTGIKINIITGEEEAKLTFNAVLHEFSEHEGTFFSIDIGGGSVEITKGTKTHIEICKSIRIGAVRLKERFGIEDRLNNAEIQKIISYTHKFLPRTKIENNTIVVSTGGAITSLQAVNLKLTKFEHDKVHKSIISYHEISTLFDYLNALSVAERKKIPCVRPGRADIIHIGALVLKAIMEFYKIEKMYVSNRGVRWGLIYKILS